MPAAQLRNAGKCLARHEVNGAAPKLFVSLVFRAFFHGSCCLSPLRPIKQNFRFSTPILMNYRAWCFGSGGLRLYSSSSLAEEKEPASNPVNVFSLGENCNDKNLALSLKEVKSKGAEKAASSRAILQNSILLSELNPEQALLHFNAMCLSAQELRQFKSADFICLMDHIGLCALSSPGGKEASSSATACIQIFRKMKECGILPGTEAYCSLLHGVASNPELVATIQTFLLADSAFNPLLDKDQTRAASSPQVLDAPVIVAELLDIYTSPSCISVVQDAVGELFDVCFRVHSWHIANLQRPEQEPPSKEGDIILVSEPTYSLPDTYADSLSKGWILRVDSLQTFIELAGKWGNLDMLTKAHHLCQTSSHVLLDANVEGSWPASLYDALIQAYGKLDRRRPMERLLERMKALNVYRSTASYYHLLCHYAAQKEDKLFLYHYGHMSRELALWTGLRTALLTTNPISFLSPEELGRQSELFRSGVHALERLGDSIRMREWGDRAELLSTATKSNVPLYALIRGLASLGSMSNALMVYDRLCRRYHQPGVDWKEGVKDWLGEREKTLADLSVNPLRPLTSGPSPQFTPRSVLASLAMGYGRTGNVEGMDRLMREEVLKVDRVAYLFTRIHGPKLLKAFADGKLKGDDAIGIPIKREEWIAQGQRYAKAGWCGLRDGPFAGIYAAFAKEWRVQGDDATLTKLRDEWEACEQSKLLEVLDVIGSKR